MSPFVDIIEPTSQFFDRVRKWGKAILQHSTPGLNVLPILNTHHGYELLDTFPAISIIANEAFSHAYPEEIARHPDKESWFYFTRSTALWIDSLGLNNRYWAPRVYVHGGKGILLWGSNQWWNIPNSSHTFYNPWQNPRSTWGNGATAFFYPPSRVDNELGQKDMTVTPSLRLALYRDGFEDVDYVNLLENLTARARRAGHDVTRAQEALNAFRRPFLTTRSWSTSESYMKHVREKMATSILELQSHFR